MVRALLCALVLLAAPVAPAAAQDEADRFLSRGAYVDGQLWLLTDDGTLFRIDERTSRRTDEALPDPVRDICRRDGELLAVTGPDGGDWTLRRRSRGVWRIVGRLSRQDDDGLLAMDCGDGGAPVTLLTLRRIVEMRPDGPASVALSGALRNPQVAAAVFGTREHLYLGINAGEWGGGLQRIDRSTGAVVTIERNATGDSCRGGPINTACDPVHAIAPLPWRPGCVAVAIGLVHFMSHGRLAEVCGDRVESLYSKDLSRDPRDGGAPGETAATQVAFFGLVRSGETLRAAGVDGLYRLGANGLIDFAPYPAFREVRGVSVNFDLPDVVLVVTQINRRASVSGGAPMIVPR
jgi:hypothetical protein